MTQNDNPSSRGDTVSPELREALVALGWMYQQYCGPNFGHDFMGAGESAIEVLEKYGLGNERDGVNEVALDKLERGNGLVPPDQDANTDVLKQPKSPSATTKTLDEILDTLIDETCTPIYEGKIVTGNLITHRFMEELKAAINNYTAQRVIEELEKLPIFYEYTDNEDRVDSQATIYISNRIAELKGGIDG